MATVLLTWLSSQSPGLCFSLNQGPFWKLALAGGSAQTLKTEEKKEPEFNLKIIIWSILIFGIRIEMHKDFLNSPVDKTTWCFWGQKVCKIVGF